MTTTSAPYYHTRRMPFPYAPGMSITFIDDRNGHCVFFNEKGFGWSARKYTRIELNAILNNPAFFMPANYKQPT